MRVKHWISFLFLISTFYSYFCFASNEMIPQSNFYFQNGPSDCTEMSLFDYGMWMCMPLAMENMPMQMIMLHGQITAGGGAEQGPRGRNSLFSTSMVMLDVGSTVGNSHYFNLDLMATAERWTLPDRGYPELLQIGEKNQAGVPFIDAQHPHSSPIMGLTLSDTIRFSQNSKNSLKLFFRTPRGKHRWPHCIYASSYGYL